MSNNSSVVCFGGGGAAASCFLRNLLIALTKINTIKAITIKAITKMIIKTTKRITILKV